MTTEMALRGQQSIALEPEDVVAGASVQAKLLMDIVDKTKCYQVISGKKYLQVEAWETIGAFNSVHAITEWIAPITQDGGTVGYDAKVSLINRDGVIVGSAIMPCYFTENACKGKQGDAKDKASKSAAQTFATSKAYRMNYSYIAILAGYQPLPAEEITEDMKHAGPPKNRPSQPPVGETRGTSGPPHISDPPLEGEQQTWIEFYAKAEALGFKGVAAICRGLGIKKIDDWTETKELALEQLEQLASN